jgi:hypothetical protein
MLPESQDGPPLTPEFGVDFPISFHISIKLGFPPNPVVLRRRTVFRTAMPEAAINKNSNLRSGKENISAASLARQRRVHPIPKTPPMQFPSNGNFGSRVAGPLTPEALTDYLADGLGT